MHSHTCDQTSVSSTHMMMLLLAYTSFSCSRLYPSTRTLSYSGSEFFTVELSSSRTFKFPSSFSSSLPSCNVDEEEEEEGEDEDAFFIFVLIFVGSHDDTYVHTHTHIHT